MPDCEVTPLKIVSKSFGVVVYPYILVVDITA
jgi:hypothetical protein